MRYRDIFSTALIMALLVGGAADGQEMRLKAAPTSFVCDSTDNLPAAAEVMKAAHAGKTTSWKPIVDLDCMPITPGTDAVRLAVSAKDSSLWRVRIAPGTKGEFEGWANASSFLPQ